MIWASNCIGFSTVDRIRESTTGPNHDHRIFVAQLGHRSLVEQSLLRRTFSVVPEELLSATGTQSTDFAGGLKDSCNYFSVVEP